ncbi:UbiX family flavin prenyltransferase [Magnetococcales bacterium HHB-1]
MERPVVVAMTGASGAPYGLKLISTLLQKRRPVHLLLSEASRVVIHQETALDWRNLNQSQTQSMLEDYFSSSKEMLSHHALDDWFSSIASGSSGRRAMVIAPCSMGTLNAIAAGLAHNLITRAAAVALKERWPLLLLVREMPFSEQHLGSMLSLTRMGAMIMPAAPGFYHQPQEVDDLIDFVVARLLDHLDIQHQLLKPWGA